MLLLYVSAQKRLEILLDPIREWKGLGKGREGKKAFMRGPHQKARQNLPNAHTHPVVRSSSKFFLCFCPLSLPFFLTRTPPNQPPLVSEKQKQKQKQKVCLNALTCPTPQLRPDCEIGRCSPCASSHTSVPIRLAALLQANQNLFHYPLFEELSYYQRLRGCHTDLSIAE